METIINKTLRRTPLLRSAEREEFEDSMSEAPEKTQWVFVGRISEDNKKWLLQKILKAVVSYNRFWIKTKINVRHKRKQNQPFNVFCEFLENIYILVAAFFTYITYNKIEPSHPAWISICRYIPSGLDLPAITNEIYMDIPLNELKTWANNSEIILDPNQPYRITFYNKYLDAKTISYSNEFSNISSDLLIAKICPDTTLVRFVKNADPDKDLSVLESSSSRFLEIEYKCGDQYRVAIEVPKSHYLAGNEILSKTYILRYLEHTSIFVNWTFKEAEYSLRIVDDESEMFSLNSRQYIKLLSDGYQIMEVDSEPDDSIESSNHAPAESRDSTVPAESRDSTVSDESAVLIESEN